MTVEHAEPGQVIDLGSYNTEATTALVKTDQFEAIRMVLPADKNIPEHQVDGQITVQCLSGNVTFVVDDQPRELTAGSWLYLEGGVAHSLHAKEPSALLVTILF